MRTEYLILIGLVFKCAPLAFTERVDDWIVWNVGQGQWITHVQNDHCTHYDVGGEFGVFKNFQKKLQARCLQRQNRIVISHWDYDHYLHLPVLTRAVPRLCWFSKPKWIQSKKSVTQLHLLSLPICRDQLLNTWRPSHFKNLNASSSVVVEGPLLIPGDSPIAQEKIWRHQLKGLNHVKILILGHHGSSTSTGTDLLRTLPEIKMAISSARYAKYRHPHSRTLKRLKDFSIPVLRTEDWGHLHINYYSHQR